MESGRYGRGSDTREVVGLSEDHYSLQEEQWSLVEEYFEVVRKSNLLLQVTERSEVACG